MRTIVLSIAASAAAGLASGQEPSEIFAIHCGACHAVDHALVGPSLVEISSIYQDDREGFVAWCLKPGRKRPQAVEMPAMGHLGEEALAALHAYVLDAAAGKTERAAPAVEDFSDDVRRPRVQRIFLPDVSPAAIAVALPGDLSYCFDGAECRLRYVWRGGFIDGEEHWKGNGSSLAKIDGGIIYREDEFPLEIAGGSSAAPKFLGYRMEDGLPTFLYERGGVRFSETLRPLPDGGGIERIFTTDGRAALRVKQPSGAIVTTSTGGQAIQAAAAQSFTLTVRWK